MEPLSLLGNALLLELDQNTAVYALYGILGLVVLMFAIVGTIYFINYRKQKRPAKQIENSNEAASDFALKLRTQYQQERGE